MRCAWVFPGWVGVLAIVIVRHKGGLFFTRAVHAHWVLLDCALRVVRCRRAAPAPCFLCVGVRRCPCARGANAPRVSLHSAVVVASLSSLAVPWVVNWTETSAGGWIWRIEVCEVRLG